MRIELTPSSAVPVSATAHDVSPGAVAFAWPLQLIVPDVVKWPSAVPFTFRSPAQVALNAPFALIGVCSDTFHLKSLQELGAGIRFDEVQLPISELLPATVGAVGLLSRSKPMQPPAMNADDSTAMRSRFFILFISVAARADFARQGFAGRKKYTKPEAAHSGRAGGEGRVRDRRFCPPDTTTVSVQRDVRPRYSRSACVVLGNAS